jgi:glutathione gamma-glutamylcysteinyltransferase
MLRFNSPEGKKVFKEALEAGHLEGCYWDLAENFNTQGDPATCSLGALAMCLNSLAIDPGRQWKGVWRWFSQESLVDDEGMQRVRKEGMDLVELTKIARSNKARARMVHANTTTLETFRRHIELVTSKTTSECTHTRMIVSFDRAALGQTGAGHFSPIAAYHPTRDLVLVMDVARFKYLPYWIPVADLFAATLVPDTATGNARGYVLVSRREEAPVPDASGQPCSCAELSPCGSVPTFAPRVQSHVH